MGKIEQYEISDGKLKRKRDFCPDCGTGVFFSVPPIVENSTFTITRNFSSPNIRETEEITLSR